MSDFTPTPANELASLRRQVEILSSANDTLRDDLFKRLERESTQTDLLQRAFMILRNSTADSEAEEKNLTVLLKDIAGELGTTYP